MSDYIHDTDAVIELHNLIRQLGPLQYAWMAKPQPNADAITESLHKITNLLVNHYGEMNPFPLDPAMNQRFDEIQDGLDQMQDQLNQMQEEQRASSHRTIQLINRFAPPTTDVCYPHGAPHDALHELAHTILDVTNITDANATAALGLLEVAIPDGADAAQRRLLLQEYLGIA